MARCCNGVSVLYRDREGRILMVRRKDPDTLGIRRWELPTGGVEPGETFKVAAVREFQEETNLAIEARDLMLVGRFAQRVWIDGRLESGIMRYFEARKAVGELLSEPNDEVSMAMYLGLDEVRKLFRTDQTNVASVRLIIHKLRCETGFDSQPIMLGRLAEKVEESFEDMVLQVAGARM